MKFKILTTLLLLWTGSVSAILVEEPASCFRTKAVCALKAVGRSFLIEDQKARLHLSDGSILIRQKNDEYVLVKGELYVESLNSMTSFFTEYVQVRSQKGGFWVLKNAKNQTVVRNIQSSDLNILSRKGAMLPQLISGFENWYAGLSTSGNLLSGILRPIDFSTYMKEHLKIDSTDPVKAVNDLKKIKINWEQSQASVSNIYEQVVIRKTASEDQASEESKNVTPVSESESKKLQKLYREKNFIDPELVNAN